MATLEKPKKEKSKKTKTKQKSDMPQLADETEIDTRASTSLMVSEVAAAEDNKEKVQMRLEDLEQFEGVAATTKTIVSHDCLVASDYTDKTQTDEETCNESVADANFSNDSQLSLQDELAQALATNTADDELAEPSAPPADVSSLQPPPLFLTNTAPKHVLVQYPNLAPLQRVETKSKVIYQEKVRSPHAGLANSQIQPYTAEQLQQLYHCAELELVYQFELEFLMNSLLERYETDPLYAALLEYYNLQSKLTMNLHDIKEYRKGARSTQAHIWVELPITKSFTSRCADNVEVLETVTYNITKVDGKNLETASAALSKLYDLVCHAHTTNLITAKITKVKIDEIIRELISHPGVAQLDANSSVILHESLDASTLECMAQLRRAIAILFSFARRFSPNANFDADLKCWLRQLISLHLLIATKEDHWFLLFNILRCPSGVGNWATEYLQVPLNASPNAPSTSTRANETRLHLGSAEVNHCIAVLQILLLPIKKRNDYLKEFTQSQKEITDPVKEERWILVDSDGEDSHNAAGECIGLKESDLIALLNQIPFERLFTSALTIEKFLDDYIIEPNLISANQILKVFAFFSKLIEIFGEGLLTYNIERYKQLAKRLGRLVRHCLQYVTDYNEVFMLNSIGKDQSTCERIAVELNALLIKACSYIYRTRNLATWQYFSSLPFASMSTETIWQLFYFLNVGFPAQPATGNEDYSEYFTASDFWSKFNVANADSSAEDLYYLLQAFFEMANERDKFKDWDLIKAVCLHIFYIGFINESTREICYKTSRDMLVNLTLAYEELMSCLLLQLKVRFAEIENAVYLFKSLPLENWKPTEDSFEVVSNWLLHFDFQSQENMVARIIISHLNWGFDYNGSLFLQHNIHVRMACLVSEALNKHAPETIGLSGISESVRQVSSLIDFTQSTKEQFTTWCWSMVSVLRLHLMDQSVESVKKTLQNPLEPLMFILELEAIPMIYQGVTENRPLALYVGLLVSLHGHSIPLICQRGFELMKLLLNDYRHAAVVRALELIVPLFLDTPETLANCESFHVVMNTLFNADKTYLKMAKDMLYANSIGPVMELMSNMIHHQIINYANYGLASPLNLINIWLNCLTSLPNWQNTNVVYLLDQILRVAYQFPDARLQAVEYFQHYLKDSDDWKGANKLSTIKTFFGSSQTRIPAISPYHAWLALVILEIEFKTQDSQFWAEFLRQLAVDNGKTNLDNVLKKTLSIVKWSTFPAPMLVVYKYANLVANMDISHPLFPVANQKFFELYLSRVPLLEDDQSYSFENIYGVSDRFFEFNVPLMKKIKTNLKAADVHYTTEAAKCADDEAMSYFYRNCSSLMKTYLLWLEETTINRQPMDCQNFPPQYNNEKLREIQHGNTHHWTEFIYLPAIRKQQRYEADKWARKCFRSKSIKQLQSPLQPKTKTTPSERIKRHLSSYDKQLPAPKYLRPNSIRRQEISSNTMKVLKDKLKILTSTANKFHLTTSELNSLNRNYLDMVLNLYHMVSYQEVTLKSCNSLLFNRRCTGPARINTVKENIRKDDAVDRKIEIYRERHDKIIEELLALHVEDFAKCIEQLSAIMKELIATNTSNNKNAELITKTGIAFFYAVVENMTEITMKFTPTNELFIQILSELGVFIQADQNQQGLTILELALKRPELLKVFSGVFVPYRTKPETFLKLYKFLIDSYLKRCDTKILFVLLSKFDFVVWLDTFQPKLHDINQLLQLVLRGLECWSQTDSNLLQSQFQRHLVHIFSYDFPQHYGEVMQMVLDRISDQKVMPVVLCDIINSLLAQFSCDAVNMLISDEQIQQISIDFARRQNLFNLKAGTDTVMLFARHFQKERLSHGLHGLYPKHKDYCKPLSIWFSIFGHVVVVSAICTYQDLLADQISEIIFGSLIEMYSPWLIPYTEQTLLQQSTSNWIRQLTDKGKMLYPWSEAHAKTSSIMIKPFINTLVYVLQNLPVSHKMLSYTFGWYVQHFAIPNIESHVYAPIHEGIATLPWELFKPEASHIDMLYESLTKYIPESHAMLGHIFIRVDWNAWFANIFSTLPYNAQTPIVSRLFTIFIKIAFEPNIHIHVNTSRVLEDAASYPWHLVEYAEVENLLKWFVSTVEPAIVLQIPTETNYSDRAVMDLLRLACAMKPEYATPQPISNSTAKRILYTRSYVRLLRSCAAKNQKLLATKHGLQAFNTAFLKLLQTMDASVQALAGTKTLEERRREALNLIIEIVVPMQTQSEETSNLHIDTLMEWQARCPPGNLMMCNTLSALGHMSAFIAGIYALLESSIVNYFRSSEECKEWHTPAWNALLQTLRMSLDKMELMPLLQGPYFLTLHIFILYKIEKMQNLGEKITFLQDISQLVENLKTSPHNEAHMGVVWGIIISRGCKLLSESDLAKKPLLMLARHLQIVSTQAEGWSDNLLGAIGFKKDNVTNRRKVLTRCLACVIFSLFPYTSGTERQPNQEFRSALNELTMLLANNKFLDVKPLVVKAVSIIRDQSMPALRDVPYLICRLIAALYETSFLTTIPEVWDFEFVLT